MSKFPMFLSVAAVAVLALTGCATNTSEPGEQDVAPAVAETPEPVETPTPTPTPATQPEMPGWAQEMHWLIYPDGFECAGTEGCPNDYVSTFGQPGDVLPENVEYYNPEKHECTVAHPAGVDCVRYR